MSHMHFSDSDSSHRVQYGRSCSSLPCTYQMSLQRVWWASNNLHISEAHRNEGIFLHQSVLLVCLQPLFCISAPFSLSLALSLPIDGFVVYLKHMQMRQLASHKPCDLSRWGWVQRHAAVGNPLYTHARTLPGLIPPPPSCHLSFNFFSLS